MQTIYFHGTTPLNRTLILDEGFQLGSDGRFGEGIYLTPSIEVASSFGTALLVVEIDEEAICRLSYTEIATLFGEEIPTAEESLEVFLDEAEGFPQLREWVLSQGYFGCKIEYRPDDLELVVYDPAALLNYFAIEQTEAGWFPVKQFDPENEPLTHIGTLNPKDKGRFSYEGHGLSVSTCPEDWQRIAQLGSLPWHTFEKEGHRFLDFHNLLDSHRSLIVDWGLQEGYITEGTAYQVTYFDEEEDSELSSLYQSYEEAQAEADCYEVEPVSVEVLLPTTRLFNCLKCQIPLIITFDLLTTLFVEEVLQWDGVFWNDDYGYWSAPRAVIVPTQLSSWTIL